MKNKKIFFHSDQVEFDIARPEPASRSMPEWYRKMLGVSKSRINTVKKCVPVLDALTAGYMIPLPADISRDSNTKTFKTQANVKLISMHSLEQTEGVPLAEGFDPQPYKWENHWYIKTPKGYSTLFIHPLNRQDLPFYSFSAIVDTDQHPLQVNFPFVIKEDFNGVIPAGTPMIQAIPFKRDDWVSEISDDKKSYYYPLNGENEIPPFAWYKRKFWKRKLYS
jgi:hypothetical protein